MQFSNGLLKSLKGPFEGMIFYAQPVEDVLNRVQFKVYTWHGAETEEDWQQGGWWHFNSVIWDEERVHLYTEVTSIGAELVDSYSWPKLSEDLTEQRAEELYDPDRAWYWVSEVLSEPLGLGTLREEERTDSNSSLQRELKKRGVGEVQD